MELCDVGVGGYVITTTITSSRVVLGSTSLTRVVRQAKRVKPYVS